MKITVPNIRQVQYEICWAACIEMVARYICDPSSNKLTTKTLIGSRNPVPMQYEILEEFLMTDTGLDTPTDNADLNNRELLLLKNFCTRQGGFPRMPYNIKGYQGILNTRFKISSMQIMESNFPSYAFLTGIIDKKQPIILGIKYPGVDNNHAVVVKGYIKKDSQRMLIINDPLTDNGNGPVCLQKKGMEKLMNYELLNMLNRSTHFNHTIPSHLINIVYNFSENAEITENPPETEISSPKVYESPEDIVGIVKGLFDSTPIFDNQPILLKFSTSLIGYKTTQIRLFLTRQENLSKNILIPIYYEDEQPYEVIVVKATSDISGYYFIGVQESYFPNLKSIKTVFVKDNVGQRILIEVNQINPNYYILQILPINLFLMVFQIKNTETYVSLSDIPDVGIKYLSSFVFKELAEILVSSFPDFSK